MSPKEKALELYWKYIQLVADGSHPEENAKDCALIAVDEILKENKRINLGGEFPTPLTNYWQEVKKELEKL